MKPRITISLNADGDVFEIWINPAGRDLLVRELQRLNERSDHIHLGTPDYYDEITLSGVAYRESDKILAIGKILFRLDEWDAKHFPHVMPTD